MLLSVLSEKKQAWREFMRARFPKFWSSPQEKHLTIPPGFTGRALEALEILARPQMQLAKYKRQIAKLDLDAERIEGSITLQLDLKLRHASFQEAHLITIISAVVIGFTVVTIIFALLAFLIGFFALSINVLQACQHESSLENGAPYYAKSFVVKGMGKYACGREVYK
jgi:hypothetical protein